MPCSNIGLYMPGSAVYNGEIMKKPELSRLLALQRLLLTFSNIQRVVLRYDAHKQHIPETDTEHSYNLAMTAWYLSAYFPELNQHEVLRLALAHDMLEVHAGDTYIYGDPAHLASKVDRETKALAQLEQEWPDFPELTESMHAYNKRESDEAKFVYALDKIMPVLQIYINDGKSWQIGNITLKMLREHKTDKVALSPQIQPYFDDLCALLARSPDLIKPT